MAGAAVLGPRLRPARLCHNDKPRSRRSTTARRVASTKRCSSSWDSRWIADHRNLLVGGACGVGKLWLSCALAQKACRDGYAASNRRDLMEIVRRLWTRLDPDYQPLPMASWLEVITEPTVGDAILDWIVLFTTPIGLQLDGPCARSRPPRKLDCHRHAWRRPSRRQVYQGEQRNDTQIQPSGALDAERKH